MQHSRTIPALLVLLLAATLAACTAAPAKNSGVMPLAGTTESAPQPRLGFSNFAPPMSL